MELIEKIKTIEQYICKHFEDWDLDDPIAEGYFEDYASIPGAAQKALLDFEEKFALSLPDDFKELYRYKDGSKFFPILPVLIDEADFTFNTMSLQELSKSKENFQNRDALLTEFSDYFTSQDIENMKDERIKPYLFNRKWFPFAEYCNSCFLMLDFDPAEKGVEGQVICYIHDPDRVVYVAPCIDALLSKILEEL